MKSEKPGMAPQGRKGLHRKKCRHHTLVKENGELSEADTDVQIYVCASCRTSFTVTI